MEQNNSEGFQSTRGSRIWGGLVLLGVGILLLAYKMGAPIPSWVFTWPMILITVGFFIGVKSRFQNPGSFILLAIGGLFLADKLAPDLDFKNYIVPIVLIAIGLLYILKPKSQGSCRNRRNWREMPKQGEQFAAPIQQNPATRDTDETSEYVDINAVFGGVKKNIFSKNFKGGEINSFMGGTDINLMQADFQGTIWLEVNNVFGGTKLVVPANWNIKNEVTAVFGGIEDKRSLNTGTTDFSKVMILKGSCVFGGIEISNY